MANGKPGPNAGLVIGALVVGGVVGYLIGQATREGPGITAVCGGQGSKFINIRTNGAPDCTDAEIYPTLGDTVTWVSPSGTTLQLVFKDPSVFQQLLCGANHCESRLANGTASHNVPYDYKVNLFGRGTPTPGPTAPTPTPRPGGYGRIIIKP